MAPPDHTKVFAKEGWPLFRVSLSKERSKDIKNTKLQLHETAKLFLFTV